MNRKKKKNGEKDKLRYLLSKKKKNDYAFFFV